MNAEPTYDPSYGPKSLLAFNVENSLSNIYIYFFFRFSLAVSAVENHDECRLQNFSIPPMTQVVDFKSLSAAKVKTKVPMRFFFSFKLAESALENDDECRKQNFYNPHMNPVIDAKSLPAAKTFCGRFFSVSAIENDDECPKTELFYTTNDPSYRPKVSASSKSEKHFVDELYPFSVAVSAIENDECGKPNFSPSYEAKSVPASSKVEKMSTIYLFKSSCECQRKRRRMTKTEIFYHIHSSKRKMSTILVWLRALYKKRHRTFYPTYMYYLSYGPKFPASSICFCLIGKYFFYQMTNGPVNAHLRSAVYTNKHV